MPLTSVQIDEVLNYTAFKSFEPEDLKILKDYLSNKTFSLDLAQIEFLFSDHPGGGLICDYVTSFPDSFSGKAGDLKLFEIVYNSMIVVGDPNFYPRSASIELLVGKIGAYNDDVIYDVKELVEFYIDTVRPDILTAENRALFEHIQLHREWLYLLSKRPDLMEKLGLNNNNFEQRHIELNQIIKLQTFLSLSIEDVIVIPNERLELLRQPSSYFKGYANYYSLAFFIKDKKLNWKDLVALSNDLLVKLFNTPYMANINDYLELDLSIGEILTVKEPTFSTLLKYSTEFTPYLQEGKLTFELLSSFNEKTLLELMKQDSSLIDSISNNNSSKLNLKL